MILIDIVNNMLIEAWEAGKAKEPFNFRGCLDIIRKHEAERSKNFQAGLDAATKHVWEDIEGSLRETWVKEMTPMFKAFAEAYDDHERY